MARNLKLGSTSHEFEDLEAARGTDHIGRNRAAWEKWAPKHLGAGRKAWADSELRWGLWGIPESRLGLLRSVEPGDDVIELGCGTAEISAWLARRSVRPVAVDIAHKQVQNVESLQRDFDVSFPVFCTDAENVHYEDESFDVALSEYGASLWCDPLRWIPEARRLLRPGGLLIFLTSSPLLMACTPENGGFPSADLVRDYFNRSRVEFDDEGPVEFHMTHGEWTRVLRANDFVVEDLIEVRPPAGARARFNLVTLEWARRWPSEDIWIVRRAT